MCTHQATASLLLSCGRRMPYRTTRSCGGEQDDWGTVRAGTDDWGNGTAQTSAWLGSCRPVLAWLNPRTLMNSKWGSQMSSQLRAGGEGCRLRHPGVSAEASRASCSCMRWRGRREQEPVLSAPAPLISPLTRWALPRGWLSTRRWWCKAAAQGGAVGGGWHWAGVKAAGTPQCKA